ncbi:MAG: RluA family pseudouridine synthase [Elusimicrobiota bacterium]|jgi:23S rRNA pseudouridine1911/1915/1917 synthase
MPTLKILSESNGERLDVILARQYPQYSRVFLQKWVRHGGVKRQGEVPAPRDRVHVGEIYEVMDFESPLDFSPDLPGARHFLSADIIPTILFEDQALMALNKPAGLVVHPAPGHRGPTLIDWLRDHMGSSIAKVFTDPERLGLVHRLDKDTSGVLLIAKSIVSQTAISRQFHGRTVRKTYVAFVEGVPSAKKGVITAPVGRSRKQPSRMAVSSQGRPSETAFEVNEIFGRPATKASAGSPKQSGEEVSQVTLFPKTGRTHQLRVHMAAIGHPVVGDRTYGSKAIWAEQFGVTRSLLHAQRLEFQHPVTKKPVSFEAPWPADFCRAQLAFRQAFKVLWMAIALGGILLAPLRAEETAAPSSKKPKVVRHASSSGVSSSSFKQLKKEVSALKDQMDVFKSELSALESGLADLNVSKRLADLEKAIPEINAKSVSGGNAAEESKTQILEANRKLKNLQDTLDQMRDQVDRLQRQAIQHRTSSEVPAVPEDEGAGKNP